MAWGDLGLKYPYCAVCGKIGVPLAGHSYGWRAETPVDDVHEAMNKRRFVAGLRACADEPNDRQVLVCSTGRCSSIWEDTAKADGAEYAALRIAAQERRSKPKPSDDATWAAKSAVLEKIVLAARAKLGST